MKIALGIFIMLAAGAYALEKCDTTPLRWDYWTTWAAIILGLMLVVGNL